MSKFEKMVEAHKNIYSIISDIQKDSNNVEENAANIAKSVSRLAGVLKIHLMNEDEFLYPAMKKSSDAKLKAKAERFQNEMGGLSGDFMTFKDKYNTKLKLIQQKDVAEKEIKAMCDTILVRMHKEDNDLYPLAKDIM